MVPRQPISTPLSVRACNTIRRQGPIIRLKSSPSTSIETAIETRLRHGLSSDPEHGSTTASGLIGASRAVGRTPPFPAHLSDASSARRRAGRVEPARLQCLAGQGDLVRPVTTSDIGGCMADWDIQDLHARPEACPGWQRGEHPPCCCHIWSPDGAASPHSTVRYNQSHHDEGESH